MLDTLDPTFGGLVAGLVGALLAVELSLAVLSWFEATGGLRSSRRTPLMLTRPFAIREHLRARRLQVTGLRAAYPGLRLPGHGRQVRDAIRQVQSAWLTASVAACPDCRGSRMRGLSHCSSCSRRLLAPAHGTP